VPPCPARYRGGRALARRLDALRRAAIRAAEAERKKPASFMGYSTHRPYAMSMAMVWKFCLAGCSAAALFGAVPAHAQSLTVRVEVRQDAQSQATARQQSGQNLPAREIERRIVPTERGAQYLGFDYDPSTNIYTLKFLRDDSVIWVDVNGRTGQVVRRSGGTRPRSR